MRPMHLPEFTYPYEFTLIIITSFYFHNVTAYELFMKSWTRTWFLPADNRPFPLNRHFACGIGHGLQAKLIHERTLSYRRCGYGKVYSCVDRLTPFRNHILCKYVHYKEGVVTEQNSCFNATEILCIEIRYNKINTWHFSHLCGLSREHVLTLYAQETLRKVLLSLYAWARPRQYFSRN